MVEYHAHIAEVELQPLTEAEADRMCGFLDCGLRTLPAEEVLAINHAGYLSEIFELLRRAAADDAAEVVESHMVLAQTVECEGARRWLAASGVPFAHP